MDIKDLFNMDREDLLILRDFINDIIHNKNLLLDDDNKDFFD